MADPLRHSSGDLICAWPARIRVLNNPSLWGAWLVGFGVPSIIMGFVFGVIGRADEGLIAGAGFLLFFLVIFLAVGAVIDLFGGFKALFQLTETGVWSLSGKGTQRTANAALVGGVFAGSASSLGAGIAAREEAKVFIPWDELRSVKVHRGARSILIRGSFGTKPIRLYCTPDNFDAVLKIVLEKSHRAH